MRCDFCGQGSHFGGGWYLSAGGFGCKKCITQCKTLPLCENLAFQRHRGVSRCKPCWERKLEEEEESARRSYEERIAEWDEKRKKDKWRYSLSSKPTYNKSRESEYFCPDCSNLLNNRKCDNTNNCNIGIAKVLTKKEKTQHDNKLETEDTKNTYFSRLVESLDGYFEWPSTETSPRWFGSSILDTNGWPEESPLKLLGYNVNQKDNLSTKQRFTILTFIFSSPRLPWVKNQQYMLEWGPASSSARLKRIANHLATMGRGMRRKNFTEALSRYDTDLDFLKEKIYNPMFKFAWPSTEEY